MKLFLTIVCALIIDALIAVGLTTLGFPVEAFVLAWLGAVVIFFAVCVFLSPDF